MQNKNQYDVSFEKKTFYSLVKMTPVIRIATVSTVTLIESVSTVTLIEFMNFVTIVSLTS